MAQLQEADHGLTEMAMGQDPGDANLLVKFYTEPVENKEKSAQEGRPIYEDKEFVSIRIPGNQNEVVKKVTQTEINRFPRHYEAFKQRGEEHIEGTPLSVWPGISRSQVEELKYFGVQTVEQLATLSDAHAQKFMGINMLRSKANLFLEAAKDSAATEQLAEELGARDQKIESLENTIQEMANELKELRESGAIPNSKRDSKPGRGRGRQNSS